MSVRFWRSAGRFAASYKAFIVYASHVIYVPFHPYIFSVGLKLGGSNTEAVILLSCKCVL